MRIPYRFRSPQPVRQPERLLSIRFLTCPRCMSHGYFATSPVDPSPMVAFSQIGALQYLGVLSAIGQISSGQYAAVERQILTSGLPNETPYVVREILAHCMAWEERMVELASIGRPQAEKFRLVGIEVAQAVHEYLLGPQGRSELKTQ